MGAVFPSVDWANARADMHDGKGAVLERNRCRVVGPGGNRHVDEFIWASDSVCNSMLYTTVLSPSLEGAIVRHRRDKDVVLASLGVFDRVAPPASKLRRHAVTLWKADWFEVHARAVRTRPWLVADAHATFFLAV